MFNLISNTEPQSICESVGRNEHKADAGDLIFDPAHCIHFAIYVT